MGAGRGRGGAAGRGTSSAKKQPKAEQPKEPSDKDLRYSNAELRLLGKIVLECVPLGPDLWGTVTDKFNEQQPSARQRKVRNIICKKWNEMANSKAPTGDPHMPEHIRLAKRGQELMIRDAEMVDEDDALDAVVDGGHCRCNDISALKILPPTSIFVLFIIYSTRTGAKHLNKR